MMDLEQWPISEKTFLVTGAGTGIGYSIADHPRGDLFGVLRRLRLRDIPSEYTGGFPGC